MRPTRNAARFHLTPRAAILPLLLAGAALLAAFGPPALTAPGGDAGEVVWMVEDGPLIGLQVRASAADLGRIWPPLNPHTDAFGRIALEEADSPRGVFIQAVGPKLPVVLLERVSTEERLLSDAVMALVTARNRLAEDESGNPWAAVIDAERLLGDAGGVLQGTTALEGSGVAPEARRRAAALTLRVHAQLQDLSVTGAPLDEHVLPGAVARVRQALALLRGPVRVLTGTPGVQLSTSAVDFGQVCTFEQKSVTVTITNKTAESRRITFHSPGEPFSVSATSVTLDPNASAEFTVRCTPTAVGQRRSSVRASWVEDEEGLARDLNLTVTGVRVLADPHPLDFGKRLVNTTTPLTLKLKNCSVNPIAIRLQLGRRAGQGAFALVAPVPTTLGPMEERTVTVNFTPGAVRAYSANLQIQFPEIRGPRQKVALLGEGVAKVEVPEKRVGMIGPPNVFQNASFAIRNNSDEVQVVQVTSRLHREYFTVAPTGTVSLNPGQTRMVDIQFGATGECVHRGKVIVSGSAVGRRPVPVQVTARAVKS
jgi:hypothetical protein